MAEKFQNKYRIPSARLQTWDYGSNGLYFLTFCTLNRKHFFGKISPEPRLIATPLGKIAETLWAEIPAHYPFAKLEEFVVMPNHVHGIIKIDKQTRLIASPTASLIASSAASLIASPAATLIASQPVKSGGITGNHNPMLHENIARIIRWYKGRCTFEMRKINPDFAWQTRFYDIIIWNEKSHQNIRNYIINNPKKWVADRFYKKEY